MRDLSRISLRSSGLRDPLDESPDRREHRRLIPRKEPVIATVELDEFRCVAAGGLVLWAGRIVGEGSPETPEGEIGLLMAGVEDKMEAAE